MGYSRSLIVDADNPTGCSPSPRARASASATPPEGLQKMDVDPIDVVDSPDLPPLWQVFGGTGRPTAAGRCGELSVELASPDAALHIGPQLVVLETAAIDVAAGARAPTACRASSSHVMFLARGKVGPFRVEAADRRRRRHGRRAGPAARRGQRRQGHHRRVVRLSTPDH